MLSFAAESGIVVVDDPFDDGSEKAIDRFNDNYLLGDISQYPNYYLQNFHWQTDGSEFPRFIYCSRSGRAQAVTFKCQPAGWLGP